MKEIRILSPCGILGYGFPAASFLRGIEKRPHAIVVDAGSTDAGPHKLGSGVGIVSRIAAARDLGMIMEWGYRLGIPVLVGSAGGAGARPHVDWTVDIAQQIAVERGLRLRTAVIYADVDREFVRKRLRNGQLPPLGPAPSLSEESLDETISIVGQMGHEPLVSALDAGAQLVIAGRAYDPAPFAAVALREGFDPGLAYHLGKILECGALCAEPGSAKDCILGTLREDHFVVEPLDEVRRCRTTSVAAHTLYEKDHPYTLHGPGVQLDLSACSFEQFTPFAVRVAGSRMVKPAAYTIKLEGAARVAFRTFVIAGIRDPLTISHIAEIEEGVVAQVADSFNDIPAGDYSIRFINYGKDGVMGPLEPEETPGHELGIVIDVVAKSQELARTICATARSTMLHYGYQGRKATAGNLAFPFSPSDVDFGPVYRFTVYHLVEVDDPHALFTTEYMDIGS